VASQSNHGKESAAALRQAQHERGVRRSAASNTMIANTMMSLSNHGWEL
jgi:hypothetical protein